MKVFKTSKSLVSHLSSQSRPLGFVPTMGALHDGHLSLINKALEQNHSVLISIFINPTQFDNQTDLENYPTHFEADLQKIEKINGNISVYLPKAFDIYGQNIQSKSFDLGGLDGIMEGEKRSGHFQGVATVVSYFLNTFQPEKAYFGEKDFQQLRIVNHITQSQKLKTKIVSCPIVREKDGLAMSSRNALLTETERKFAPKLYESLCYAKKNAKHIQYGQLKDCINDFFKKYDLLTLDYFRITNAATLKEIDLEKPVSKGRAFIAAHLGKIRLIDNMDMS
jgi:pantoate--beta-alanine ligase